jgi:hypothetical protein
MTMLNLSPASILVLAGALVYAAGIACALWVRWSPPETTDAEPLSRLDAREGEDAVTLDKPSPHRRN